MPRYDYRCSECGDTQTVTHGFNESPILICYCGKGTYQKVFSATPAVFKGTGWGGKP